MIKDASGKQRIVTMPIDQVRKLQQPKPQPPKVVPIDPIKKPEEKDNFFLGNDDDGNDDANVKVEVIEGQSDRWLSTNTNLKTAEEETATIEEIDGSEEESMNIIESATIKEEPDVTKIGADGIDHSALEGMINLCER